MKTVHLHVVACLLVVPGVADCQFPVYLWQSLSSTWSSRVHHGGQQQKRWTSQTLYPPGDSINWTSRKEIEVTRSQLTVKAVTKRVCVDYSTNTSDVCHAPKETLYHVTCLTSSLSDIYRVQIHGGGQVNRPISRYFNSSFRVYSFIRPITYHTELASCLIYTGTPRICKFYCVGAFS